MRLTAAPLLGCRTRRYASGGRPGSTEIPSQPSLPQHLVGDRPRPAGRRRRPSRPASRLRPPVAEVGVATSQVVRARRVRVAAPAGPRSPPAARRAGPRRAASRAPRGARPACALAADASRPARTTGRRPRGSRPASPPGWRGRSAGPRARPSPRAPRTSRASRGRSRRRGRRGHRAGRRARPRWSTCRCRRRPTAGRRARPAGVGSRAPLAAGPGAPRRAAGASPPASTPAASSTATRAARRSGAAAGRGSTCGRTRRAGRAARRAARAAAPRPPPSPGGAGRTAISASRWSRHSGRRRDGLGPGRVRGQADEALRAAARPSAATRSHAGQAGGRAASATRRARLQPRRRAPPRARGGAARASPGAGSRHRGSPPAGGPRRGSPRRAGAQNPRAGVEGLAERDVVDALGEDRLEVGGLGPLPLAAQRAAGRAERVGEVHVRARADGQPGSLVALLTGAIVRGGRWDRVGLGPSSDVRWRGRAKDRPQP